MEKRSSRKKLKVLGLAHKVVKIRSTTLSSSSCGLAILDEIAPIPSSFSSNLIIASVHLDV
jgi:hypothetical protein